MRIKKIDTLDNDLEQHFENWLNAEVVKVNYDHSTGDIVSGVMDLSDAYLRNCRNYSHNDESFLYPLLK